MDGVVENQNLALGVKGCTLIFQAATHLVAVVNSPTFSLCYDTEACNKGVYIRLRATVRSVITPYPLSFRAGDCHELACVTR